MGAIIGAAVLGGISSSMEGKANRKAAKEGAKNKRENIKLEGDEQRKTARYGLLLGDWQERKGKFRKSQAMGNYRKLAQKIKPKSAHSALMRNAGSTFLTDPGDAPISEASYVAPPPTGKKGRPIPQPAATAPSALVPTPPPLQPPAPTP